ncbi:hypothetical protein Maes01_01013 [Microbulbifer aestuariivivens]|uniref:HTH cro/C1-type domain-containing protein n=2 Tax=Microbulbifer aestuariivivens TaxID=1908308 RepID=A0ABP9WQQ6_9GAMM
MLLRVLGEQLRRLRLAENCSQEELACASGIGMSTLKRLEGGRGCHLSSLADVLVQLGLADPLLDFFQEQVREAQAADTSRRRASRSRASSPE